MKLWIINVLVFVIGLRDVSGELLKQKENKSQSEKECVENCTQSVLRQTPNLDDAIKPMHSFSQVIIMPQCSSHSAGYSGMDPGYPGRVMNAIHEASSGSVNPRMAMIPNTGVGFGPGNFGVPSNPSQGKAFGPVSRNLIPGAGFGSGFGAAYPSVPIKSSPEVSFGTGNFAVPMNLSPGVAFGPNRPGMPTNLNPRVGFGPSNFGVPINPSPGVPMNLIPGSVSGSGNFNHINLKPGAAFGPMQPGVPTNLNTAAGFGSESSNALMSLGPGAAIGPAFPSIPTNSRPAASFGPDKLNIPINPRPEAAFGPVYPGVPKHLNSRADFGPDYFGIPVNQSPGAVFDPMYPSIPMNLGPGVSFGPANSVVPINAGIGTAFGPVNPDMAGNLSPGPGINSKREAAVGAVYRNMPENSSSGTGLGSRNKDGSKNAGLSYNREPKNTDPSISSEPRNQGVTVNSSRKSSRRSKYPSLSANLSPGAELRSENTDKVSLKLDFGIEGTGQIKIPGSKRGRRKPGKSKNKDTVLEQDQMNTGPKSDFESEISSTSKNPNLNKVTVLRQMITNSSTDADFGSNQRKKRGKHKNKSNLPIHMITKPSSGLDFKPGKLNTSIKSSREADFSPENMGITKKPGPESEKHTKGNKKATSSSPEAERESGKLSAITDLSVKPSRKAKSFDIPTSSNSVETLGLENASVPKKSKSKREKPGKSKKRVTTSEQRMTSPEAEFGLKNTDTLISTKPDHAKLSKRRNKNTILGQKTTNTRPEIVLLSEILSALKNSRVGSSFESQNPVIPKFSSFDEQLKSKNTGVFKNLESERRKPGKDNKPSPSPETNFGPENTIITMNSDVGSEKPRKDKSKSNSPKKRTKNLRSEADFEPRKQSTSVNPSSADDFKLESAGASTISGSQRRKPSKNKSKVAVPIPLADFATENTVITNNPGLEREKLRKGKDKGAVPQKVPVNPSSKANFEFAKLSMLPNPSSDTDFGLDMDLTQSVGPGKGKYKDPLGQKSTKLGPNTGVEPENLSMHVDPVLKSNQRSKNSDTSTNSNLGEELSITKSLDKGINKITKPLPEKQPQLQNHPQSCADAFNGTEGVYTIQPFNYKPVKVYCISDRISTNRAWTLVLLRNNDPLDFDRPLNDYKSGFGEVSKDHFLGLDLLSFLTNSIRHELWVHVTDGTFEDNAHYDRFVIGNSNEGYILHTLGLQIGKLNGNGFDSFRSQQGYRFSTKTKDYTENKCATKLKAGWWFYEVPYIHGCVDSYLTSKYENSSLVQFTFHNFDGGKKRVTKAHMAIRPFKI